MLKNRHKRLVSCLAFLAAASLGATAAFWLLTIEQVPITLMPVYIVAVIVAVLFAGIALLAAVVELVCWVDPHD